MNNFSQGGLAPNSILPLKKKDKNSQISFGLKYASIVICYSSDELIAALFFLNLQINIFHF